MGNLPRVLRPGALGWRLCSRDVIVALFTAGFPKRFGCAIEALVASDAAIELSARAKRMQAEWNEMSSVNDVFTLYIIILYSRIFTI